MAKRRSNGDGTFTKRANGKWRVGISINGFRYSHTANTKAECSKWVRDIQNRKDGGYDLEAGKVLLFIYIENWLSRIKTSRSKGTLVIYSRAIVPVVDRLGDYSLKIFGQT